MIQINISTFTLIYLLLILLIKSTIGVDQVTFLQSDCSENNQYNQGSLFQNNLYTVLSNLTSKSKTKPFYNVSSGEFPNKVDALFLCVHVYLEVCQDCVSIAAGEVQRRCPSSTAATVWYAECMLRYSNRDIFSENDVSVYYNVGTRKARYKRFDRELSDTFISLFDKAAGGGGLSSYVKSASTVVYVTRDVSLGCYADCTPDLSETECSQCLWTALGRLDMNGAYIGRLLQPSCRLMYLLTDFGSPSQDRTFYITLSIISTLAAASLLVNMSIYLTMKANRNSAGLDAIESKESLIFDFDDIKAATGNFCIDNKLGQGGFGVVYMGTIADGKAIAVKRLSNASRQGMKEFKAEACLAAKLKHKNLVKLYGFCVHREEMLLVYEYLPNNSLDHCLFDPKEGVTLKWETRYKIIVGIVRGLLYLHEDSRPKIVHRDIKPSNILLDEDMNPKIADFGMAKLFGCDQTQGNTSRVAGTFGYMAPEYARTGMFSAKSDIFSLGVIILEILSGLRNSCYIPNAEEENLLDYARRLSDVGAYSKFIDSKLEKFFSENEATKCMKVGLLCIEADPSKRPDIAKVLVMVNAQPITLPLPTRPPASPYKSTYATHSLRSYETQVNEMVADLSPR
ncbi:hypothetical protein RND81_10G021900 [Saponaria officinalis]|uniref:Uncharacterized protein n=1 Tax=Saponaria officinalis TaxID=3572 RepID=A0AAW1HZX4_SAPOF